MFQRKTVLMVVWLFQIVLFSALAVPARANKENQSTPEITINFQEVVTAPDQAEANPLTDEETEPSESPAMVGADDDSNVYIPMPLLPWSPPLDENYTGNHMVMYDLVAGQELDLGKQAEMELPTDSADVVDGGPPPSVVDFEGPTPLDFSSLSLVPDPENYPWSVNVRLLIDWPNGGRSGCSGVLVDPRWIVTAGHCIFSHDAGGWATGVRVVPAYDNGDEPYGVAFAVHLFSWGGWTENADLRWDIAHVRLNQPIGAMTGWHGIGYNSADSFFEDNTFFNPGYPGESPFNFERMYSRSGYYDDTDTEIVGHNDRSYHGQSGSGSYHIDGDSRHVYAVLSHGGSSWTGHTRITGSKFEYIVDTVRSSTPTTPDLIPLDVRASPSSLTAGTRLSGLTFLVHNYASATYNGVIKVSLYLSSNNDISRSDRLLGTAQYSGSLGPKRTTRITANSLPLIPIDEGGDKWLGIIIEVTDSDPSNNDTDGWDAAPIFIQPYVPDVPANVQASNAASPQEVVIAWSVAARAVSYEVHRATSLTGTKTRIGTTTQLHFVDRSGIPGTMYYYFVRAVAVNGRVSEFSQAATGRRAFFQAFPIILE